MPGILSWGVISGVAMVGAGLTPFAALAMSVLVYAGASQLAALQLISAGAPIALALLAGFVINLRFMLFSLSLSSHLRHLPWLRRALAASEMLLYNGAFVLLGGARVVPEVLLELPLLHLVRLLQVAVLAVNTIQELAQLVVVAAAPLQITQC